MILAKEKQLYSCQIELCTEYRIEFVRMPFGVFNVTEII